MGRTLALQEGWGCGVYQPWKANVENAAYYNLPWTTWGRHAEGMTCRGTCYWTSLNGNTQGYNNAPPFLTWTMPPNTNYALLVSEREYCLGFWIVSPNYFRISADF